MRLKSLQHVHSSFVDFLEPRIEYLYQSKELQNFPCLLVLHGIDTTESGIWIMTNKIWIRITDTDHDNNKKHEELKGETS